MNRFRKRSPKTSKVDVLQKEIELHHLPYLWRRRTEKAFCQIAQTDAQTLEEDSSVGEKVHNPFFVFSAAASLLGVVLFVPIVQKRRVCHPLDWSRLWLKPCLLCSPNSFFYPNCFQAHKNLSLWQAVFSKLTKETVSISWFLIFLRDHDSFYLISILI